MARRGSGGAIGSLSQDRAFFHCAGLPAPEKELRELLDETGNSSSTDPYV